MGMQDIICKSGEYFNRTTGEYVEGMTKAFEDWKKDQEMAKAKAKGKEKELLDEILQQSDEILQSPRCGYYWVWQNQFV